MNKINIYVWNNFLKDDRVKKKAITLSKENYVVVHSVCKKPQLRPVIQFADNIEVHFYWFKNNFFKWLWYRSIGNYFFWKDKIYKCDVVDCNDPDTLWAGYLTKKMYPGTKVVYDSHEYWKKTRRKEYNLFYTLYSYVVNTWQYWTEKFLIKFTDRRICVSQDIKKKLEEQYKSKFNVVFNSSTYNSKHITDKLEQAVFFGSKPRLGVEELGSLFINNGIKPVFIGDGSLDNKYWDNKGFLTKEEYIKEIQKSKYGICVFDVTCDNIKYCLPNKLYEYIQAECPILVNQGLESVSKFVEYFDIGVVIKEDLTRPQQNKEIEANRQKAIKDLKENYSRYLVNIKKVKHFANWEHQEGFIRKLYRF